MGLVDFLIFLNFQFLDRGYICTAMIPSCLIVIFDAVIYAHIQSPSRRVHSATINLINMMR